VNGCGRRAVRGTIYSGTVFPRWWCDECDPAGHGATPGKLEEVGGYQWAAGYVAWHCGGRKESLAALVKALARARGLPDRVGEWEAKAFFDTALGCWPR
jgi:hypothetical protein